tara:strand:- start:46 stop:369 length:324 start_codon:yes stop_codon:yes gene_type:complete
VKYVLSIDIYKAELTLVTNADIKEEDWEAYTEDDEGGKVCIYLRRESLTHGVLGHEIQHAVDAVMQWVCHEPKGMDEPRAYLCEAMHNFVYKCLSEEHAWVQFANNE